MTDYTALLSKMGVHVQASTIYETQPRWLYANYNNCGTFSIEKFQVVSRVQDATEDFVISVTFSDIPGIYYTYNRVTGQSFTPGLGAVLFEDRDMCELFFKKCRRIDVSSLLAADIYKICKRVKANKKDRE